MDAAIWGSAGNRCSAPGNAVSMAAGSGRARMRRLPSVGRCDSGRMTAGRDVEDAEPEFAQRVRGLFDAHKHKTIATLRADGSPRISGIEAAFERGELTFGSMVRAPRARI